MSKPTKSEEVALLVEEIRKHRRLYEAGKPQISDEEFDRLEARLIALAPEHPALTEVGAGKSMASNKVKHLVPMLSLAKTYTLKDLESWQEGREVVAADKIDGVSISLIYKHGKLAQAKTRGDGMVGEDVTEKIRWVKSCPKEIEAWDDANIETIEIRGELFCRFEDFNALAEEMQKRGLEKPSSPRNIVAGVLGRKENIDLAQHFKFIAFDASYENGTTSFATEMEKLKWLKSVGFKLAHPTLCHNITEIQAHIDARIAAEVDYGMDGIVFTYNEIRLHKMRGFTSHHPRFRIAFKWQGQTAITTIQEIHWSTSRLGIVTPVARIQPVELSGALISNVTLHNAQHVLKETLKAGDEIEIIRSGEIIPKFLRLVKAHAGKSVLPTHCPSCKEKLEFDSIRLICPNHKDCPAQQSGFILNWIRCSGIEDLSDRRLDDLQEIHGIDHPAALYELTKDDFLELPKTKQKMAEKLYGNIQASKKIPLLDFLCGLGIRGIGKSHWQNLLDVFPTLKKILELDEQTIIDSKIKGLGENNAVQVAQGLRTRKKDIDRLLAVGVKPQSYQPREISTSHPLQGKIFVISGALSKSREAVAADIKAVGGRVSSAVSSKTTALITNDPSENSSKILAAKNLGIPFWDEKKLYEAIFF